MHLHGDLILDRLDHAELLSRKTDKQPQVHTSYNPTLFILLCNTISYPINPVHVQVTYLCI
ncbi:hypothetical protein [Escherichia phage dw-ec]|nr:hypothetical protein [Escherichia phage dw-ec]